jgi:nitroimidazol reductase NimA-like FMN-containing flavoprotein (pyridoxamine 5'-phosphate oxidase superfamily)
MRRKEKEIIDIKALNEIIGSAQICRLGLTDENAPYIVPLCFGHKDSILYFHSAAEGKKIEILKKNPNVCFEFDQNIEVLKADKPCKWGMKYQSIIGYGKAIFVETLEEKCEALKNIMSQYTDDIFSIQDSAISSTTVFKVIIDKMTGKQSGI